ncbi:MAG: hypothetical protein J7M27_14905 [Candidatus Latescibacteria bacterium]|nr:hypothetical protein [Candidatus Latescibacterota bacterium]
MKGFLAAFGTILLVLAGMRMNAIGTVHPLLATGLLIVLSFFVGEAFAKVRLPRWMGCAAMGVLLGPEGFRLIGTEVLGKIEWLEILALGWVSFRLGVISSGAKVLWRQSAWVAALVVGVSFAGTFLALLLSGVPTVFALLLGTIAAAPAPLVLSSMQDRGERPENPSERTMAICASVLVLLLWIGVMGGLQLTQSRWIPASVWLLGIKFVAGVGLAVMLSRIFGFIFYRGLLGKIFLSGWFIALHLLLASGAVIFLFAVTMGIALPEDREHRKERGALGRSQAQMAALFLIAFLGARLHFRFVGTPSFLWLIAGIYVSAMAASKLVGIYAARSMLKRIGVRRWDGAVCFLPQLFLPLTLIAATEAHLSGVPGFENLSGFSNIAYWGVLWGSLIFPMAARVKGEVKSSDGGVKNCTKHKT